MSDPVAPLAEAPPGVAPYEELLKAFAISMASDVGWHHTVSLLMSVAASAIHQKQALSVEETKRVLHEFAETMPDGFARSKARAEGRKEH